MSQTDLPSSFVWHESMTPNTQATAAFYSNVLPWTIAASTVPGHILWASGSARLAGLMPQPSAARDSGTAPNWLVCIATPEVDITVRTAQQLGGKLLKVPADLPGIGRFAVLPDPQGAAFTLFTPAMNGPLEAALLPASSFTWHTLASTDLYRALAFDAPLFDWTRGAAHDLNAHGRYQIIEHAGIPIGGLHVLKDPSKPPHWVSDVHIERIEGVVLQAVRAHGGLVLSSPHVVPSGGRGAHLMDPQRGTLALHEFAPTQTAAPKRRTRTTGRTSRTSRRTSAKRARRSAAPLVKRTAKRSIARASTAAERSGKRTTAKTGANRARRRTKLLARRMTMRKPRPPHSRRRTRGAAAERRPSALRA